MRVLLLSGEGPYFKNAAQLAGGLFDPDAAPGLAQSLMRYRGDGFDLGSLVCDTPDGTRQAMRPKRGQIPHLTSFTLESILQNAEIAYLPFRLERIWDREEPPAAYSPDMVLLSTTFICDRVTLRRAIEWVHERYPDVLLVLGGQYSNIKFEYIMRTFPPVDYVVRGDGEVALPRLVRALAGRGSLDEVPNLVWRDPGTGKPAWREISYIDIDAYPSPDFAGAFDTVPYESMRGCPFHCKFCSFPAASPLWRYKSAVKIHRDWQSYAERNGATNIRAMDSTFTVPPSRLRELLSILPDLPVTWEAYTRANSLRDQETVDGLARAHCKLLSIGFESMSDASLGHMEKLVSAAQNRRAHDLLKDSSIDYRCSFMVGYPGERPEHYSATYEYLVHEFTGRFLLNVFSLQDETMPVWKDAERFQIQILDPEDPDYAWSHIGMDADTARGLLVDTMRDVRWRNDDALLVMWQADYHTPIAPHRTRLENRRIEKLVERLAMIPVDYPEPSVAEPLIHRLAGELEGLDVRIAPSAVAARVHLPNLQSVNT